jgi:hypothetical protein
MKCLAMVLALALGGCASVGGAPSTTQISDTAKEIKQYTQTICAFVPTAATIGAMLSKGTAPAFQIASDICQAVTTAPLSEGGARRAFTSQGVRVHGSFTNGRKV